MDHISLKNSCGFSEIGPVNDAFIWSNNQSPSNCIWERIDYVFANTIWFNTNLASNVTVLERVASDHAPLLISFEDNIFYGNHIFIFEDFWIQEPSFPEIVHQAWLNSANQQFSSRLRYLKNSLLS